MANKKAASTAKKTTAKSSSAKKPTTKVTTVKAVESRPTERAATVRRPSSFVAKFNSMPVLAAAIAEFIGTFLLTAVIVTQQNQPIAVLFALVGLVLLVGTLSGAHLNPAVTIGAWVTRRANAVRAVSYIFAQVLGALLAVVVLNGFLTNEAPQMSQMAMQSTAAAAPALPTLPELTAGKEWPVFFAEFLGLTVLGFAYASALRNREKLTAAFTVGLGAYVAIVVAGTGAYYAIDGLQQTAQYVALNPAAAIAFGAFAKFDVWTVSIFVLAPVLGGIFGFLLHNTLKNAEETA
jgi:aquaporin Z